MPNKLKQTECCWFWHWSPDE